MKRLVLILLLIFTAVTISAQGPFKGFFKPVTLNPNIRYIGVKTASSLWLVRPTVELSAIQLVWNKETKAFDATAFKSAGFGIGYQHFINNNGTPYNNYGVNVFVLMDMQPTETIDAGVSVASTVSVFQYVNIGGGYSFSQKTPFILTAVTAKF